jgi:hypothetical protein
MGKTINMPGIPSTVSVMEYIRDNTNVIEGNEIVTFLFERYGSITVSKEDEDVSLFLECHPLDTWHDVFGMKRIPRIIGWYAHINGQLYFMSAHNL